MVSGLGRSVGGRAALARASGAAGRGGPPSRGRPPCLAAASAHPALQIIQVAAGSAKVDIKDIKRDSQRFFNRKSGALGAGKALQLWSMWGPGYRYFSTKHAHPVVDSRAVLCRIVVVIQRLHILGGVGGTIQRIVLCEGCLTPIAVCFPCGSRHCGSPVQGSKVQGLGFMALGLVNPAH